METRLEKIMEGFYHFDESIFDELDNLKVTDEYKAVFIILQYAKKVKDHEDSEEIKAMVSVHLASLPNHLQAMYYYIASKESKNCRQALDLLKKALSVNDVADVNGLIHLELARNYARKYDFEMMEESLNICRQQFVND